MPISSLIIKTDKNKTADVVKHLTKFYEATVEKIHQDNIVLITETDQQSRDKDLWNDIENIPGVLKCDLIYHNFEDEEECSND